MKIKTLCVLLVLMLLTVNTNLFAQSKDFIITRTVNQDKSITLHYIKRIPGSYYIIVKFSDLFNCDIKEYRGVVEGNSGNLTTINPVNRTKNLGFTFVFKYYRGRLNPKVDNLFQYSLPFKNGQKLKIHENGDGEEEKEKEEKNNLENWTSYTAYFKTADTVYSMRKGIVVKIVDKYEDDDASSKRNLITIEHEDGTFGSYISFKKNSFKVKEGETVYPQTPLGIVSFNKEKKQYRMVFSVYYYFEDKSDASKLSYENFIPKRKYITPLFITQEGITKIKSDNEYTALCNETILLQECTRAEKKKYTKDSTSLK